MRMRRRDLDLERALTWDAVEDRAPEWGGMEEGWTLWVLVHFAACFYGERLYLAWLVGGCPTTAQNDEHGWCARRRGVRARARVRARVRVRARGRPSSSALLYHAAGEGS